ncbi:MAG: DUF1524 domain-containing protein [Jatrophihabitantaceae bacterium]
MTRSVRSAHHRPRTSHTIATVLAGIAAVAIVAAGCQSTARLTAPASNTGVSNSSRTTLASPTLTGSSARNSGPSTSGPAKPASAGTSDSAQKTPGSGPAAVGTALALLTTMAIKGRAPKTGYSRDQFGSAWTDNNGAPGGHNGCDTRNDILRRDLVGIVLKANSNDCTVLTGTLHDPYTGKTIAFTRGTATSAEVQIDHVVALSDAWQTGAQQLSPAARIDLANDPLELLAVDGPSNLAKSDGDAATWLPPNKSYRCAYVARQVAVKARYGLWMTPAEHDAIVQVLAACPTQPVPAETGMAPRATNSPTSAPPPPPATSTHAQAPAKLAPPPVDVYYANCAAVRAAGKAPLHRGQPGYRAGLDRDNDGVACE